MNEYCYVLWQDEGFVCSSQKQKLTSTSTSWSCFVCNRSLTGQQSSFFKIYQGRYGWTQPISQIVSYWVLLLPTVNQNRVKICNRYLCYQPANVSLKWSKYWKFYVEQVYNLPPFILISHEALKETLKVWYIAW